MRVIAGSARGRRLQTPKGLDIRPTADRVREALFSALGPRVPGSRFLDLFAGSGANGIEALSRGAARAVFAERDPRALRAITSNLRAAGLEDRAVVVRGVLPETLARLAREEAVFDLVFADPPYACRDYEPLLEALAPLAASGAQLIVEHGAQSPLPDCHGPFQLIRERRYGASTLSWYARGA